MQIEPYIDIYRVSENIHYDDMRHANTAILCLKCYVITYYDSCIEWNEHICRCGSKEGYVLKDRYSGNTDHTINKAIPVRLPEELFEL